MSDWPAIDDPELLARLTMDHERFVEHIALILGAVADRRPYDAAAYQRAISYPWARPDGSYLLRDGEVSELERVDTGGRFPLIAIGSNGAPETLTLKFGHFEDVEDRTAFVVCGHLHDFDIGVQPQPTWYGSLPATVFPSPGTAVRAAVLWLTTAQFVQLTWTELSYHLGRLHTRFEADDPQHTLDDVVVFVSRWGAFTLEDAPVALAAIPARDRTARALTQEQLLDAAAELCFGPGARAERLVRALFEELHTTSPLVADRIRPHTTPFASDRWTPYAP